MVYKIDHLVGFDPTDLNWLTSKQKHQVSNVTPMSFSFQADVWTFYDRNQDGGVEASRRVLDWEVLGEVHSA